MSEEQEKQNGDRTENHQPSPDKESISTIAGAIQAFIKKYSAAQQTDNAKHSENIRWTRRTFKAACIYSILTLIIAGASIVTVLTARDTEHRQLRAYISGATSNIQITTDENGKITWHIMPVWHNSGITPTREMISGIKCGVSDVDLSKPISGMASSRKDMGGGETIFAGDCTFFPENITAAQKNETNRILSTADYLDVFGDPHHTEQCFFVNFLGDVNRADPNVQRIASLCVRRNCADEECTNDQNKKQSHNSPTLR